MTPTPPAAAPAPDEALDLDAIEDAIGDPLDALYYGRTMSGDIDGARLALGRLLASHRALSARVATLEGACHIARDELVDLEYPSVNQDDNVGSCIQCGCASSEGHRKRCSVAAALDALNAALDAQRPTPTGAAGATDGGRDAV